MLINGSCNWPKKKLRKNRLRKKRKMNKKSSSSQKRLGNRLKTQLRKIRVPVEGKMKAKDVSVSIT